MKHTSRSWVGLSMVALALLFAGYALWGRTEDAGAARRIEGTARAEEESARPAPSVELVDSLEASPQVAGGEGEVEEELTSRRSLETVEEAPGPGAAPTRVQGRVFDPLGRPVAGVAVSSDRDRAREKSRATTDAAGAFSLELGRGSHALRVEDESWIHLRHAVVTTGSRHVEQVIVVAPWVPVAGRVVDAQNGGVEARVKFVLPANALDRVPVALDGTRDSGKLSIDCDGEGRFAFERLPVVAGASLHASAQGHGAASVSAPRARTQDLWIRLEDDVDDVVPIEISGRVLFADRSPVPMARVFIEKQTSTFTKADGSFRVLVRRELEPDCELIAVKRGFEPAVLEGLGARLGSSKELTGLELIVPGEGLTISGRVVTETGEPCEGWRVKLVSGSLLNPGGLPPVFAEEAATAILQAASAKNKPAVDNVMTGEDGEFVLGGLRRGERYRLRAWNRKTLMSAETEPIAAGTRGYRFVIQRDMRPEIDGVVVGLDGTPIAGVKVRLTMVEMVSGNAQSYHTGQQLITDASGAFRFTDVPRVDLLLRFTGPEVDSLYYDFDADDPGRDLVIRLTRRCHLRFQGVGGERGADGLQVLDVDGRPLRIQRIEAGRSNATTRLLLEEGQSGTVAVSEAARELVLLRGNEEVGRRRLALTPGKPTIVRE